MSDKVKTFKHSGEAGDITHSLPTLRHLGGGIIYMEAANYTRQRLTPAVYAPLTPLLLAQPYIKDVREWRGEKVDHNLNDFRQGMVNEMRARRFNRNTSLAHRVCDAHRVPREIVNKTWLTVSDPVHVADVVFARCPRCRNANFPWKKVYEQYGQHAVFIGLADEHADFCDVVGNIPWQPTENFLEVARVIAGAKLFVGNQSCPYAIAEGLKQNAVLEVAPDCPNCIFERPNVWHGWDGSVTLPALSDLRGVYECSCDQCPVVGAAETTVAVPSIEVKSKPRIFIDSCHTALEYDQARMFSSLGFRVAGRWDRVRNAGERLALPGVTEECSEIEAGDIVILHQRPEHPKEFLKLAAEGRKVVLVSFGQAGQKQYQATGVVCRQFPNARIAAYSRKDHFFHIQNGCPPEKVALIRFGKFIEDYAPWRGEGGYIYAACNRIHQRGEGCGWGLMQVAMQRLKIVLSGIDTENVGGVGQIPEEEMRTYLRDAAGFISFGTAPAPLVLTQIEAWCAGCPTVIWNNGHGITKEGLRGIIEPNVEAMIGQCQKLLSDPAYRASRHEDSLNNRQHFDVGLIGRQWMDLLRELQ